MNWQSTIHIFETNARLILPFNNARSIKDLVVTCKRSYTKTVKLKELTFTVCFISPYVQYEIPEDGFQPPYIDIGLKVGRFYYDSASKEDIFQKAYFFAKYYAGSIGVVLINL